VTTSGDGGREVPQVDLHIRESVRTAPQHMGSDEITSVVYLTERGQPAVAQGWCGDAPVTQARCAHPRELRLDVGSPQHLHTRRGRW
jgi:hypothetical protein